MSDGLRKCFLCGFEISNEGHCLSPSCPLHNKYFPFLGNAIELLKRAKFDIVAPQQEWLHVVDLANPTAVDNLLKLEKPLASEHEFDELFKSSLASARMFELLCDQHTARLLILLMVQHYLYLGKPGGAWHDRSDTLALYLPIRLTQEFLSPAWSFRGLAPIPGMVPRNPAVLSLGQSFDGKLWRPGKEQIDEFLELAPGLGASFTPEEMGVDMDGSQTYYESWFFDMKLAIGKHPGYLPTLHEVESRFEAGLNLFLDTVSMFKGVEINADFIQVKSSSYWWARQPSYVGGFSEDLGQRVDIAPLELRMVKKAVKYISGLVPSLQRKSGADAVYLLNALDYVRRARRERDLNSKLVDYVIALEALYSLDGDELTEKLARRCSILLGRTDQTAVAINGDIKELYRKRSRIVHGKPEKAGVREEDIAKADLYTKASVLAFLSLSARYRHDELIDSLDVAALATKDKKALHRLVAKGFWGKAILALLSKSLDSIPA